MRYFIFLTNEGKTYQTNSNCIEPDCENSQLIGIAQGENSDDAFVNLKKENPYLQSSKFNELFCYELKDYLNNRKNYNLKE